MGRPITERIEDPKFWGEEMTHAAIAFALSSGIILGLGLGAGWGETSSIMSGLFAVWLGSHGYELGQNWGDAPTEGGQEDSIIDLAGFGLGGLCSIPFGYLL